MIVEIDRDQQNQRKEMQQFDIRDQVNGDDDSSEYLPSKLVILKIGLKLVLLYNFIMFIIFAASYNNL